MTDKNNEPYEIIHKLTHELVELLNDHINQWIDTQKIYSEAILDSVVMLTSQAFFSSMLESKTKEFPLNERKKVILDTIDYVRDVVLGNLKNENNENTE